LSRSKALRRYISLPIASDQSAQLVPGLGGDILLANLSYQRPVTLLVCCGLDPCNSYTSFDLLLFCYLLLFMCLSSFSLSPFGLGLMGHQSLMATSLFSCIKAKVQPSLIDGQTSFSKDRFPFLQTPKRTVFFFFFFFKSGFIVRAY
jgi:hypothetical protein